MVSVLIKVQGRVCKEKEGVELQVRQYDKNILFFFPSKGDPVTDVPPTQ